MNWALLAEAWPFLLGVAVVWSGIVYLLTRLEPPVPTAFEAECRCGHPFSLHSSEPHGTGSPCRGAVDSWECTVGCRCEAFEPCDRPTEPLTLSAPPGFDFRVYRGPDGTDRFALVPACAHSAYAVEVEGVGAPLRCLGCGEELAE